MFKPVLITAAILLLMPALTYAQETPVQKLEVYDPVSFEKKSEIVLENRHDKLSFQAEDLGQDGISEIILGAPSGELPEVIILRNDGSEISRWLAYGENYRGGVIVSAADVNDDGSPEIITGTRESGGPHIRIFTPSGILLHQWFAFDPDSRAGVSLASGDVAANREGSEIIVVKGEGEEALLRIFTQEGELLSEWYPFGPKFFGGINVDVSPDGFILTGRAFGRSPLVRVFNRFGGLENEFMAYYEEFPGGVKAQAVDSQNGGWDIITAPGFSGGPHVRNFSYDGRPLSPGFHAFAGEYKGGLVFDEGDIDGNGRPEIIVGMETITPGPNHNVKSIVVDLSDQTLTTYYRGYELESYLISSGLNRFPTPQGEFSVTRKRDKTRMSWYYGENNPDNYDLPDVPHVLTFLGPYNIHGAYWHNNFGYQMSHGCVNMSLPDAEEVYNWAEIGTAVIVKQ